MKKIIVGIILIIVVGIGSYKYLFNNTAVISDKSKEQIKSKDMLTMMLETEAGTGVYEETTANEWPIDGYVFNAELSKCENGGTLSWDDENKKVVIQSNTSDKCYIYFDIANQTFADYIINKVYTEDGVNGLYYHDGVGTYTNADQEAGDNSYRYSGANPNNYVCFGTDTETCPEDNLYRIIGLFDDDKDGNYSIKLIKNLTLGTFTWDSDIINFNSVNNVKKEQSQINVFWINNTLAAPDIPGDTSDNNWPTADLNYYINNNYFWNVLDIKWQSMIDVTNWVIGGNSSSNIYDIYVKNAYQNEVINPANIEIYTDEIGLMYVSDYGYAASPENWKITLNQYNNNSNTTNNWLYLGIYNGEWTITRNSGSEVTVFKIQDTGEITYEYVNNVTSYLNVRPVFYLKFNVIFQNGMGTMNDPYRVKI